MDRPFIKLFSFIDYLNPKKEKVIHNVPYGDETLRLKDIDITSLCFTSKSGNIYNGKHKLSGKICSVKVLLKSSYTSAKDIAMIDHEIKLINEFKATKAQCFYRAHTCEHFEGSNFSIYVFIMEPILCNLRQIITIPAAKNQDLPESDVN
jgi:hypothetical protein